MEDIQQIPHEERGWLTVQEIMSEEIKMVSPDDDIFDALKILSQEDIGRLMVVEDGKLVGIITRSDIIKGFRLRQMESMS